MQTNPVPSAPAPARTPQPLSRRRRRWLALLLVFVGGLATVAFGAARVFSNGRDARVLTTTVMEAAGGDWQPNIQIRVGPVLFTLARLVTLVVPDVPPEARTALQAIRSAEVSIHHLAGGDRRPNRADLLVRADASLSARGWERVVGVVDGAQLVAVYTPAAASSARNLRLCVLVLESDELITVNVRGDVEQIAGLAWRLRDEQHVAWWK